jgi:hypothetical protein
MEITTTTRTALIQHGYGMLAIVMGNSYDELALQAKSNYVDFYDAELDCKRPYTAEELSDLPFNPANFIENIADGELYVTTHEELISQY